MTSAQSQTKTSPRTLSYQGLIAGPTGSAIAGEHTLTITIYADPSGKQALWRTADVAEITSGQFSCLLGSAENPLPDAATLDRPLWLGIGVDNNPEARPLTSVAASAYALNVADAAITTPKLADNSVSNSKLQDRSVTWNKMGTEYVPYIRVNGTKVNTGQNSINFTGGGDLKVDFDSTTLSLVIHQANETAETTGGKGPRVLNSVNGSGNNSNGFNDFLGGGLNNKIQAPSGSSGLENTLTGGDSNFIGQNADRNFIGGGERNKIWPSGAALGSAQSIDHNTLGGGFLNNIADHANSDTVRGAFIGGGELNSLNALDGVIGGGRNNAIVNPISFSTIAGGQNNLVTNQTAAGSNPSAEFNSFHFIGGGEGNTIISEIKASSEMGLLGYGSIVGGQGNTLVGPSWGFIGGGQNNIISNEIPTIDDDGGDIMQWDVITGGNSNSIDSVSSYSMIGGGNANHISGSGSYTGPGHFSITTHADRSFIGGGDNNIILSANSATIGGGTGNSIDAADYTFIGGGLENRILPGAGSSIIGGGWNNLDSNRFSAISAGLNNITSGEAQTILGFGNLPSGHGHKVFWSGFSPNDDRVLEIGSPVWDGSKWVQSNAFEVSYSGHSIVYHTNGSSIPGAGIPPVYQGATYVESPVYAWGEVDASGNPVGNANFGISQVIQIPSAPPGVYLVTLAPADPHGPNHPDISQASVTVTVVNNNIADIPVLPPPPPQVQLYSSQQDTPRAIPDSIILATGGTLSNPNTDTTFHSQAPAVAQPLLSATFCGYATASEIGILGPLYPNSFIVRTFTGGESGECQAVPRSFFFKVCHR